MAGEGLQGVVAGEVGRLLCQVWADDGSADALLSRAYGKTGAAIVGAPVRYSKRAFQGAFCGIDPPEPRPGEFPGGKPPELGKCPVLYNVKGLIKYYVNPTTTTISTSNFDLGTEYGPFSEPYTEVIPAGNLVLYMDGKTANGRYKKIQLFPMGPGSRFVSYSWQDFSRVDGQPDRCGDLGYDGPGYDGPVTYPGPDGPVTTNVSIRIGNPKGDSGGGGLTIPFAWISPELNLNGEVDLEPTGNFEFGGGGGDSNSPRIDPDSPVPPPGGDDPPPPGTNREIVGVVVVSSRLASSTTTTEYGDGVSPDLYLPRCASLVFAVNIAGSGSWMQPIDVEVLRQWIPVPGDFPAYLARAKPMNGYACQVFPVYADDGVDESE